MPSPALTATVTVSPGAPEPLCRTEFPKTSLTSKTATSPHGCPGTEYLRDEGAGGPRPLRPPGKRHALPDRRPAITAPAFPGRPAPGKSAGQRADAGKCTLSSAANVKPTQRAPPTLVRGSSVVAAPVRGRPCKADGPADRRHITCSPAAMRRGPYLRHVFAGPGCRPVSRSRRLVDRPNPRGPQLGGTGHGHRMCMGCEAIRSEAIRSGGPDTSEREARSSLFATAARPRRHRPAVASAPGCVAATFWASRSRRFPVAELVSEPAQPPSLPGSRLEPVSAELVSGALRLVYAHA